MPAYRSDGKRVRRWYAAVTHIFVVLFFTSLGFIGKPSGDDPQTAQDCATSVICPQEELTYDVTYLNIHLGQIRVRTYDSQMTGDSIHYKAVAYADSYEGLPFVNLHEVTYSDMNKDFFSLGSRSLEKDDDRWALIKTINDFTNQRIIIERGFQPDLHQDSPVEAEHFDTLQAPGSSVVDGLSLLYFARANVRRQGTMRVPAVVNGKLGAAVFNFSNKTKTQHIDALGGEVRTVELDGKAEFEGTYGMTGDFKGWFTDDTAAIPVKGELQVIIGHVTVELTGYKRDGWNPPLAANK
jgi:hypothetical protein